MLVTITGGSIITIASGATSGTVSVADARRGRVSDSSTVSRSITGASGGNFESPAASTVAATDQHQRHHRRHHGEPHGQPERGRRRQHHLHREPGRRGAGAGAGDHHRRHIITIASAAPRAAR
ncbi:MAG: hypothetical protein IPN05_19910 [Sulfuritalea sp.]|nr:hypothetical protein [Sulfuritalea sp.]